MPVAVVRADALPLVPHIPYLDRISEPAPNADAIPGSLSGEQLVFSNTDLLSSRIRNYRRMQERRILFGLDVIYQTPRETLERIPGIVREVIESQDRTRFDRAHFARYGASSLDFEVVYYMLVPDYNAYMDTHQVINLDLFGHFEDEGIEFAYPTRTLFVSSVAEPATVA